MKSTGPSARLYAAGARMTRIGAQTDRCSDCREERNLSWQPGPLSE